MDKLTVFGSARIDAFMDLPSSEVDTFCKLNTGECVMELSYSTKIPLKRVEFLVGGNGANVSVGTKRMGISSVLVAELGQGALADQTMETLKKEGIRTDYVSQSKGVAQGFGAVIVYQGERTILSYYAPERPPFPKELKETQWAYLTSVGEQFEGFYDDVLKWMEGKKTKLAFNPGGRQIRKGKEWMQKFLSVTDLHIANREETENITGMKSTHGKEKELIEALTKMGPKMAVVTDGRNGAFAFDGNKFFHAGIMPIDAIERTGAGDAFSTGLLVGLLSNQSLGDALLCGTVNSASVIGYVGPEKGLLSKETLPEWMERAKSSNVEVKEF